MRNLAIKSAVCVLMLLVVCFFSGSAYAQTYLYNFQKVFDPFANSDIRSMKYTVDPGYAFTGGIEITGDGSSKVVLSQLNDAFLVNWMKTYIAPGATLPVHILAHDVFQTVDEGYIVCGRFIAEGTQLDGTFLMKTDPLGTVQWFQVYSGIEQLFSVVESLEVDATGLLVIGYLACGYTRISTWDVNATILKTDEFGNVQWVKEVEGTKFSNAVGSSLYRQVIQYDDDKFALVGMANSELVNKDADVLLTIIDGSGNIFLNLSYGLYLDDTGKNALRESGTSLFEVPDGSGDLVITGNIQAACITVCGPPLFDDILLFRIDSSGGVVWAKQFGQKQRPEYAAQVIVTQQDRIFVSGYAETQLLGPPASEDVLLLQTNLNGFGITFELFGDTWDERGNSLVENSDGNVAVIGNTTSFNPVNNEIYLIERFNSVKKRCHDLRLKLKGKKIELPVLNAVDEFVQEEATPVDVEAIDIHVTDEIICKKLKAKPKPKPFPVDNVLKIVPVDELFVDAADVDASAVIIVEGSEVLAEVALPTKELLRMRVEKGQHLLKMGIISPGDELPVTARSDKNKRYEYIGHVTLIK